MPDRPSDRHLEPQTPTSASPSSPHELLEAVWYLESRSRLGCAFEDWHADDVAPLAESLAKGEQPDAVARRLGELRARHGFDEQEMLAELEALVETVPTLSRDPDMAAQLAAAAEAGWNSVPRRRRGAGPVRPRQPLVAALEPLYDTGRPPAPGSLVVVDASEPLPGPARMALLQTVRACFPLGAWYELRPARRFAMVGEGEATARRMAALRVALRTDARLADAELSTWVEALPADRHALPGLAGALTGLPDGKVEHRHDRRARPWHARPDPARARTPRGGAAGRRHLAVRLQDLTATAAVLALVVLSAAALQAPGGQSDPFTTPPGQPHSLPAPDEPGQPGGAEPSAPGAGAVSGPGGPLASEPLPAVSLPDTQLVSHVPDVPLPAERSPSPHVPPSLPTQSPVADAPVAPGAPEDSVESPGGDEQVVGDPGSDPPGPPSAAPGRDGRDPGRASARPDATTGPPAHAAGGGGGSPWGSPASAPGRIVRGSPASF